MDAKRELGLICINSNKMYQKLEKILKGTENLQIEGATTVAKIVVDALEESREEIIKRSESKEVFIEEIKNIAVKLAEAQPTETMAQNILGFLIFALQEKEVKTVEAAMRVFDAVVENMRRIIEENEKKFVNNGLAVFGLLKKESRPIHILTHCHSSGVRKVLEAAKREGINFKVFNTETRPAFLGRAAAKNMTDSGINVTMIVDSAAPFVLSGKSGHKFFIDAVFLGCDAITISGGVFNKIGSYGISLAAFHEKKPVYIVASLLKVKKGLYNIFDIPLEIRSFKEVWQEAPEGLEIVNFAFDVVPSNLITGFITEFGVLKPDEIKEAVRKNYPTLL